MLRLSVQANEMYSSLQSMVGASAADPKGESPADNSRPQPSVFSPKKDHCGRGDDGHGSDTSMTSVASSISVAHSRAFSEVDRVLSDLRRSMATLAKPVEVETGVRISPHPPADAPSTPLDEDAILNKYSDRLAEMVSEKVAAKMSASMSLGSFSGSAGASA